MENNAGSSLSVGEYLILALNNVLEAKAILSSFCLLDLERVLLQSQNQKGCSKKKSVNESQI